MAYKSDGDLHTFQLIEQIEELEMRFKRLEVLFNQDDLDRNLVTS